MEALYAALQDEIQVFKEHIKSCQKAFDLHTLYNVLQLLSGDGGTRDILSLEQLERLAESQEWDEQDVVRITMSDKQCDISSYVSWFLSYVKYLGSLKEVFDTKVVFPLCEHLYINDDPRGALPVGRRKGRGPNATSSIASTAKQLFSLRRKWALLLKEGEIDKQVFSPQSWLDLQGFANVHRFVNVMRLVPDLFHKSLANAKLARQWVELHANRHSHHPVLSGSVSARRCNSTGLGVGSLQNHGYKVPLSQPGLPKSPPDWKGALQQSQASSSSNDGDPSGRASGQGKSKLYEIHRELLSLLWREERSWTLEADIQEINQRISTLQLQWEDKARELEAFEHQLEKDNWTVLDMKRQTALRELDDFRRQLRLEEYRKHILQSDWLLELEVRPVLLHPIHTVRAWG